MTHSWPWFLPDGNTVLFVAGRVGEPPDDGTIEAVRIDDGERKVVLRGGTYPRFVPSGHLVYSRENTLFAAPFDPDRGETTGEARPVVQGVMTNSAIGAAAYAFSSEGTLTYVPAPESGDPWEVPRELLPGRSQRPGFAAERQPAVLRDASPVARRPAPRRPDRRVVPGRLDPRPRTRIPPAPDLRLRLSPSLVAGRRDGLLRWPRGRRRVSDPLEARGRKRSRRAVDDGTRARPRSDHLRRPDARLPPGRR